jgi:hypothetical protein
MRTRHTCVLLYARAPGLWLLLLLVFLLPGGFLGGLC